MSAIVQAAKVFAYFSAVVHLNFWDMSQSIFSRIRDKYGFKILPTSTYQIISWWFLRGIGLVYLSAFGSMASQISGLIGEHGILPLEEYLNRIADAYQDQKYWYFPTLFWVNATDDAFIIVCMAGIIAASLVIADVFIFPALIVCYVCYLSITTAGQDFTAFQWDVFLLESGFLGIFLPFKSKMMVWLFRLLIARFMLMGGVVKIASGDPTWANLTALSYHYLTQPLPSPLGYYAYFMPNGWHGLCTAGVLFIELIIPFFVFMSRPLRLVAAGCFILLQTCILLTGSYNFFNLLTLLLCLFLFDDRDLMKITPQKVLSYLQTQNRSSGTAADICAGIWAGIVVVTLSTHLWLAQKQELPFQSLATLIELTSAFSVINNYGPFAVMTTERNEIIIEGSQDGVHWQEYSFTYKPDSVTKPLVWNIPHQPRLDWQMWFAALSQPYPGGWFEKFMQRLHEGSPEVLALLAHNPFPKQPPIFLRAFLYQYTYVPPRQHYLTGQVWNREKLKRYWP